MNLEKRCKKCGLEILREGDVGTWFAGKKFCKCILTKKKEYLYNYERK